MCWHYPVLVDPRYKKSQTIVRLTDHCIDNGNPMKDHSMITPDFGSRLGAKYRTPGVTRSLLRKYRFGISALAGSLSFWKSRPSLALRSWSVLAKMWIMEPTNVRWVFRDCTCAVSCSFGGQIVRGGIIKRR